MHPPPPPMTQPAPMLAAWLEGLGLAHLLPEFERQRMTMAVLPLLLCTGGDFHAVLEGQLKVEALGDRLVLIAAIAQLSDEVQPAAARRLPPSARSTRRPQAAGRRPQAAAHSTPPTARPPTAHYPQPTVHSPPCTATTV